jgi:hypothetical protein
MQGFDVRYVPPYWIHHSTSVQCVLMLLDGHSDGFVGGFTQGVVDVLCALLFLMEICLWAKGSIRVL